MQEFPRGFDIIYESVGGDMFNLCLNALAVYGRLIVIGMISQVVFSENTSHHSVIMKLQVPIVYLLFTCFL